MAVEYYVRATKVKGKTKEGVKSCELKDLFIPRGQAGEAILKKVGKDYTPVYKWVEEQRVWRPV